MLFHWVLFYLLPLCLNSNTALGSHGILEEGRSPLAFVFLALNVIVKKAVSLIRSCCWWFTFSDGISRKYFESMEFYLKLWALQFYISRIPGASFTRHGLFYLVFALGVSKFFLCVSYSSLVKMQIIIRHTLRAVGIMWVDISKVIKTGPGT